MPRTTEKEKIQDALCLQHVLNLTNLQASMLTFATLYSK